MDELGQPLNDAEAKVAMSFLDEDGNGVIDFNEFVAWWAGTVRTCVRVCVCVRAFMR
jgi:Ca2+-binding EF-hand superfamily protein